MTTLVRKDGGFTLLEAVAVLLLLSLVVAGVLPLLTTGEQSYDEARRRQEMLRNARVALDRIVRELRAAQSLRQASSGVLRFDLAAEAGEVPTVEFVLDSVTGDLQYRWASAWDYRRRITVQAPAGVAVPAGYSVYVCFDHASLVGAGKSRPDGADVRVRFWDGSRMVELDRFLEPTTAWNGTQNRSDCPDPNQARQVKLWFRVQAAIPAGGSDNRYFLYYGNPQARPGPSNPDHVFLDYEDGSSLYGWIRRDGCPGIYSVLEGEGFRFRADSSNNCYRQLSRRVPHSGVEVMWKFRSGTTGDAPGNDRHMVGMGAGFTPSGDGYVVSPGEDQNRRLRIRRMRNWNNPVQTWQTPRDVQNYRIVPGTDYFGRFYLLDVSGGQREMGAKFWSASSPEGDWMLRAMDSDPIIGSGEYYTQADGYDAPMTHWHRFVWIRMRVEPEPSTSMGPEESGARADRLATLAGPFREMNVTCFDAAGAAISCNNPTSVRQVEVRLVARDREGKVPDVAVAARAVLRTP
jgi:type II secretory pathway pseudopilin PulG